MALTDMLPVAECFSSIQGEGANTGIPMVFLRVAGCNLSCAFCDTDHSCKESWQIPDLYAHILGLAGNPESAYKIEWVCLTGGEPTLYIRQLVSLIAALKRSFKKICIETNGTNFLPFKYQHKDFSKLYMRGEVFDWITVSPKRDSELCKQTLRLADEWKVVIEDASDIKRVEELGEKFRYYDTMPIYLQPVDNNREVALMAIEACKYHRNWRLSVQVHKFLGLR